jgi:putative photosynthetic complex assembly protein
MMANVHDDEIPNIGVPRPVLIGAGLLILATIVLAWVARLTGAGAVALPAADSGAYTREIAFHTEATGELKVQDAGSQQVIAAFRQNEGGFVRGSLRALRFERERRGLPFEGAPYRLVEWRNGRLTLDDPETGYHIELNAFGPQNVAAYRSLLH